MTAAFDLGPQRGIMGDIAIRVEEISKRYRLGKAEKYKTLRDTLASAFTAPFRSAGRFFRGKVTDDTGLNEISLDDTNHSAKITQAG